MTTIDDLLLKYNIIYAIFVQVDGTVIEEYGDLSKLKFVGIYNEYFRETSKIVSTNNFLHDKQLPQTIIQGEQCCILTILNEKIISGLFFIDNSHVLQRRKLVKEINIELQKIYQFKI